MSALTILVAGKSGQVARSLVEAAEKRSGLKLTAMGRPELDIADRESVESALARVKPDILINAAAYTAVDNAENDREAAYAGNEAGPRHLAEASAAQGIPMIHISTDYVFDGEASRPYTEQDAVSPLGVYGKSKFAGEEAVAHANPEHLILRTAWVYGAFGKNFLKTMLAVAENRDELRVVADQKGAPTSSHDIAEALLDLAEKVGPGADPDLYGTYHMTARGECVWAEFAEAIFAASAAIGGPTASVEHIPSSEYPTPAKRPAYSVLDSSALEKAFGVRLPDWREPVASIVARILKEKD
ncbi:dTDP-4-dehydrorhamnose reductase [Parvularcula lutaonensis]|uniref:dTDP-4-dehydrorhamnose reductase n=1 Tax=Parvularcula lutaonensis TaxID=491923 RepID=A0ABV7MFL2_9PROT|nr:dTDP-4-dehydrorhamnose reductase [Parvularcula lutaonensis]GGY53956.1 NAD(P)-dependent oxidoreductase [Parvularcula lutaonensis]